MQVSGAKNYTSWSAWFQSCQSLNRNFPFSENLLKQILITVLSKLNIPNYAKCISKKVSFSDYMTALLKHLQNFHLIFKVLRSKIILCANYMHQFYSRKCLILFAACKIIPGLLQHNGRSSIPFVKAFN